jgi:protein-disulfide isomerase
LFLLLSLTVPAVAQDPVGMRAKGSATAPVTVYEMADFQCPACREFATRTFASIERDFIDTGKVRWVFINFPLTQIHPNAVPAAEFAMCAARQGKFWLAHDWLYENQDAWARLSDAGEFLVARIRAIGLNEPKMRECLESGATLLLIREDAAGAAKAGARSTPSFYIEGGMMSGSYPYAVYKQVLDSVVATKRR